MVYFKILVGVACVAVAGAIFVMRPGLTRRDLLVRTRAEGFGGGAAGMIAATVHHYVLVTYNSNIYPALVSFEGQERWPPTYKAAYLEALHKYMGVIETCTAAQKEVIICAYNAGRYSTAFY